MNVDAYLGRIGYDGPVAPTADTLRLLHVAHLYAVPFENLDKIFEEYTSYSGGQDRSGGGLGLAICKFILNLHQGQVWAECDSEGSTFSFVLPFVQQEAQLAIASDSPQQVLQAGA